ncbi:MAG TPA: ABC transporter substrate-binding protein [Kiloniellales bacterium]|nr:ABC transporter substrate-binding protein [Kiloniellales bacterium]
MMQPRRALALLLLCGLLASDPLAAAAPGVEADRIVFGQSAALEGPAAALGQEMRRGILAAFAEVNAAGGIGGRRLELVSYDDGYEPERAIDNTERLIEEDRVFALIGAVGTPTSAAVAPIAVASGVPFIGPFTGAEFLRDPALTTVVNVRASYFQETERIAAWLTDEQGIDRIAVLYQDDSFGRVGLQGMRQALARRGLEVVSQGVYPRNTTAVKRALLAIRQGDPEAVVIVGTYAPSAAFTLWARKLGLPVLFVNLSFVGSEALAQALVEHAPDGAAVADTYISQVVPPPDGETLPLLAQYRAAIGGDTSFISLEGYIAGRLAIAVLQAIEGEPTREAFLASLQRIGSFDLGGFALRYGPGDNQGSDAVFLTAVEADGRIVAVEDRP